MDSHEADRVSVFGLVRDSRVNSFAGLVVIHVRGEAGHLARSPRNQRAQSSGSLGRSGTVRARNSSSALLSS